MRVYMEKKMVALVGASKKMHHMIKERSLKKTSAVNHILTNSHSFWGL